MDDFERIMRRDARLKALAKERAKLKQYRKKLKKHPTKSEVAFKSHLEKSLKGSNYRIIEQKQFLNYRELKGYFADFYIPILKIIFEVDGLYHQRESTQKYDAIRTHFLNSIGIKVIRVQNEQTKDDQYCITLIKKEINKRQFEIAIREKVYKHQIVATKITHEELATMQNQYISDGGVITVVNEISP